MRTFSSCGVAYRRRFFYFELDQTLDLDELLLEAYILVHKVGFTYIDVKGLTRTERAGFLKLYTEEIQREEDAIKQSRSSR
jgi:hypothetical protein